MQIWHRLLENPAIYSFVRTRLAPDVMTTYRQAMGEVLAEIPPPGVCLDVGCGPGSLLWQVDLHPFGIDPDAGYAHDFAAQGGLVAIASGEALPYSTGSLDSVWCFSIFHHLPDDLARRVMAEMVRVCCPGGTVVIFDIIRPHRFLHNPFATLVRNADRGEYVRPAERLLALLPDGSAWRSRQYNYTIVRLSMLVNTWVKPSPA